MIKFDSTVSSDQIMFVSEILSIICVFFYYQINVSHVSSLGYKI